MSQQPKDNHAASQPAREKKRQKRKSIPWSATVPIEPPPSKKLKTSSPPNSLPTLSKQDPKELTTIPATPLVNSLPVPPLPPLPPSPTTPLKSRASHIPPSTPAVAGLAAPPHPPTNITAATPPPPITPRRSAFGTPRRWM